METEVLKREWLNLTPEEYHALDALGSGALRCHAIEGNLEFYARYIAKTKQRDDTDAMRMGRAFHAAMENDGDWEGRYVLVPESVQEDVISEGINYALDLSGSKAQRLSPGQELNFKLPSHRQYFEAWKNLAANEKKDFLTPSELETVKRQVHAVYDNPECRDILSHKTDLLSEVACILHHESGIDLKALLDRVIGTGIVDFKKTCKRNPCDFYRDACNRGYDRQMGHYLFVSGKVYAVIISVTDEPPFEANAWEMPAKLMQERIADTEHQVYQIAQLKHNSYSDELDSQGVPLSFHNELWGARIEFSYEAVTGRIG